MLDLGLTAEIHEPDRNSALHLFSNRAGYMNRAGPVGQVSHYNGMAKNSPSLAMPSDFPADDLTAFMLRINVLDAHFRSTNNGQPSAAWREFASGAEGLRVRFRSLADADQAYRVVRPRGTATHEDRYEEERAIFVFFASLVSTFECTYYLFYSVGAQLDAVAFPLITEAHKMNVNPRLTVGRFRKRFHGEQLSVELATLADNALFDEAYAIRNVLSHRGSIPRHYDINFAAGGPNVVVGGPNSTVVPTMRGLQIDATFTSRRRDWVSSWLRSVMTQAQGFAARYIQ